MIVKEMIQLLQWDCARFVTARKLNASSCHVDMQELVKNVLQESKTLDNPVLTAGKECLQHIVFTYNYCKFR